MDGLLGYGAAELVRTTVQPGAETVSMAAIAGSLVLDYRRTPERYHRRVSGRAVAFALVVPAVVVGLALLLTPR